VHILAWLATGLVAGLVANLVANRKLAGLFGSIALGLLGAVAGGWLFRLLGITAPESGMAHVATAAFGALTLIAAQRLWANAIPGARAVASAATGVLSRDQLAARVAQLSGAEHRVLEKFIRRIPVLGDATATPGDLTLGQRAADRIASFGGSWPFLGIFAAILLSWIAYNSEVGRPFDPFPFILLNLVLSCLAAVQAPVIMMSQNRQAEKDRLNAKLDYDVNLKAEIEILALHEKLDQMREKAWGELLEIQERQLALLDRIERTLGSRA